MAGQFNPQLGQVPVGQLISQISEICDVTENLDAQGGSSSAGPSSSSYRYDQPSGRAHFDKREDDRHEERQEEEEDREREEVVAPVGFARRPRPAPSTTRLRRLRGTYDPQLMRALPGEPQNPKILIGFEAHVAYDIFNGTAWIYQYFPCFRPDQSPTWDPQNPRPWAKRWYHATSPSDSGTYSQDLDRLTARDIGCRMVVDSFIISWCSVPVALHRAIHAGPCGKTVWTRTKRTKTRDRTNYGL